MTRRVQRPHRLCAGRLAVGLVGALLQGCGAPAPPAAPQDPAPAPRGAASTAASASAAVSAAPPAEACAPLDVELPQLGRLPGDPAPVPLIDGQRALGRFYAALARLARGKATEPLRLAVYGDSNLTRDHLSGELRRQLQRRYGDGGHGYHAAGQPWSWYLHRDVRFGWDARGWRVMNFSTDQTLDRQYGHAGIAVQSTSPQARSWVATAPEGAPVGTRASRLGVTWLQRPGSGSLRLLVDGQPVETLETAGPLGVGQRVLEVPDGPHRLEVVTGARPVRLLGFALERSTPGVVVDCLAVGGVNTELIVKGDAEIAKASLRLRPPALVLLFTGTLEPDLPKHAAALERFIALHREALPEVEFLLLGATDLAGGTVARPTTSAPRLLRVSREKARVAKAQGAAYWDTRGAMGGDGSIVRFAAAGLAWSDLIHLTERGGWALGERLSYALLEDFSTWLAQHPRAGCD